MEDSNMNLGSDYELIRSEKLGKGAFGTVYKGRILSTGRSVAVKVVKRATVQGKFLRDQLRKEISLMQDVESQNILRVIDLVGTESHIFIILEFCAYGDLRSLLERMKYTLSEENALGIFSQVVAGLSAIFRKGYLHRDIKPENILIAAQPTCFKIADFGFATPIPTNSYSQSLSDCVGSPFYMSPQLLQGKSYSAKSDIWSLGILLYELLFGQLPWIAARPDMKSLLIQIRKVPLRFPHDKGISEEAKSLISSCLEFEESKRITWEELFQHRLILSAPEISLPFLEIDPPRQKMVVIKNESDEQIIHLFQEIIEVHKLPLKDLFDRFDENRDQYLSLPEFQKMIRRFDGTISNEQIKHLFDLLTSESEEYLISYQMLSDLVSVSNKNQNLTNPNQNINNDQSPSDRIILEIRSILISKGIQPEIVFNNFKESSKCLKRGQFKKLARIVDPSISDETFDSLFFSIDINHDGEISLDEFKSALSFQSEIQSTPSLTSQ